MTTIKFEYTEGKMQICIGKEKRKKLTVKGRISQFGEITVNKRLIQG